MTEINNKNVYNKQEHVETLFNYTFICLDGTLPIINNNVFNTDTLIVNTILVLEVKKPFISIPLLFILSYFKSCISIGCTMNMMSFFLDNCPCVYVLELFCTQTSRNDLHIYMYMHMCY